jgi:hypothetical protein
MERTLSELGREVKSAKIRGKSSRGSIPKASNSEEGQNLPSSSQDYSAPRLIDSPSRASRHLPHDDQRCPGKAFATLQIARAQMTHCAFAARPAEARGASGKRFTRSRGGVTATGYALRLAVAACVSCRRNPVRPAPLERSALHETARRAEIAGAEITALPLRAGLSGELLFILQADQA